MASLRQLKGYMEEASELEKVLSSVNVKGGRTNAKEAAKTRLRGLVYDSALASGYIDDALVPDPSALSDNYSNNYGIGMQVESLQDASNEIDTRAKILQVARQATNDGIETVLNDSKTYGTLAGAAGPDFADWRGKYDGYRVARDLANRVVSGNLKAEERKLLLEAAAEIEGEDAKLDLRNQGYDSDIQEAGAQLAATAVMLGYKAVDIGAAAREYADEARTELGAYERANPGRNLKEFFAQGTANLAEQSEESFELARGILYKSAA